jgi:hypothetical protein
MPNEILAKICAYAVDGYEWHDDPPWRVGKEWLIAVRLTCKQLYHPATTEFGKRAFACLSVLVARGSLEKLLKICNHPVFGPQVRQIALYGLRLDQSCWSKLKGALKSCLLKIDLEGVREMRCILQAFTALLEQEVEFQLHTGIFQLLVDALGAIRGYGHSVGLAVFTHLEDKYSHRIIGRQEVIEPILPCPTFPSDSLFDRDGVESSFNTLLVAAATSGCRVNRIVLDNLIYAPLRPVKRINSTLPTADVLLDTKAFHMHVHKRIFTNGLDVSVNAVLLLTNNLEDFHLDIHSHPKRGGHRHHMEHCGRLIQSLQSNCLRKITLERAKCRQNDLILLLDRHKDTIRELHLSRLKLVGSCEEVMIWIRDRCSLARLRMSSLYEYDKNNRKVVPTEKFDYLGNLSDLDNFLQQRGKKQALLMEDE